MNGYILLALLCSFVYAVGAVICKYGLSKLDISKQDGFLALVGSLLKNKLWLLGILLTLGTNIVVLQVQSELDVSVVHAILNSSFIFTVILGYVVLEERLSKNQWLGIGIVALGATLVVFGENPVSGEYTNIGGLLTLSVISISIILTLIVLSVSNGNMNSEILFAICSGIAFGNSQVYVKAATNLVTLEKGYFSVLSWESVIEFMSIWPVLAIAFFAVTGFLCMQISFYRGKVSICVALLAVISRGISTSSGYYVFGEVYPQGRIIGILSILIGVFIITYASIKKDEPIECGV